MDEAEIIDSEKIDSEEENDENMDLEETCKTDIETMIGNTHNKVENKASQTSPSSLHLARPSLDFYRMEKDIRLKKKQDLKIEVKEVTYFDPDESNVSKSNINWIKWLILFGIFIAIIGILLHPGSSNVTDINSVVENLKINFAVQPNSTWKMISIAMKKVLKNPEPKAPAIFLFLVAKDAENDASLLTTKLAESFLKLGFGDNFSLIESKNLKKNSPDKAKEQLELEINNGYKKNHKIFVITHLEDIHGEAAMMLHSFCDDQNAPYKQAVYMMIVHCNSDIEKNKNSYENDTEKILKKAWEIEEDRFQPLFNRISVNILPIFSET